MILVDTHVLVWLELQQSKLSRAAATAINRAHAADGLAISAISLLSWRDLSIEAKFGCQAASNPVFSS